MTTAVVTDSTTSLPPGVEGRPDLTVVPLTFHFGEETYRDKVDMSSDEFYERLAADDVIPTTSQPPVGAFAEAYESLQAYDNVLVLTLSSKVSGTYEAAVSAVEMVERPVEVLDTKSAEMGAGLILQESLRAIDSGADFKEVRRAAEAAIRECNALFAVGTLEYLAKNGRIGRAGHLVGRALDVRPVLRFGDGEVAPYKKVRGRKRQMSVLVDAVSPALEEGRRIAFGYSDDPEVIGELQERLGIEGEFTAQIGGVIGSHVGPGAYGVAYL